MKRTKLIAAVLLTVICGGSLHAAFLMFGSRAQPRQATWFETESQRAGVIVADRLDTQATIDDWIFNDATGDHMSLDTTLFPVGSVGSLEHAILNTDTSASGQFTIPLPREFTEGDTIAFAYEVYFQPDDKYAPWAPGDNADGTASKLSILSRDGNGASPAGSNQLNEFVFQQNHNGGRVSAYHRDSDGNFPPIQLNDDNVCQSGDVIDAPDLDRGTVNPLSGTNPDSGAAWTACQQYRAQIGTTHYSARSNGIDAANYKQGLGDPFSVDYAPAGEWIYVQGALQIGTFGTHTADTRAIGMVARENGPWVLLFDQMIDLGAGPNYNGLNLLPYTSARTSGGRHVSARTGELASCFDIWNVGPTHATGTATLAWNASTDRLTWQASGDSAGTARGYSEANGILAVNLISSTSANFINGQFTPAACPGTNATENVTIATGRPDTKRNYANVIVLDHELVNAPDGSAPPVTLTGGGGTVPSGCMDTLTTELAMLACSMSVGEWAELTTNNMQIVLRTTSGGVAEYQCDGTVGGDIGAGGHIIPYANQAAWDSVDNAIRFAGADHHHAVPGYCMIEIQYLEADNTWSVKAYDWNPNGCHGYGHTAVREDTGDMYVRGCGGGTNNPQVAQRRLHADSAPSSFLTSPNSYTQIGIGTAWWPGSNSGATAFTGVGAGGSWMVFEISLGTLLVYDPVANDWDTVTIPAAYPTNDPYQTVAAYSGSCNCIVYGGGNNGANVATAKWLWRLNQNGTTTRLTDSPINVGAQMANLVADPVSGKFLIWGGGRKLYELDPSGSGSYTDLSTSRAPPARGLHGVSDPSVGDPDGLISVPIPKYGVTAYISANAATYANVFLYKHAAP